MSSIIEIRQMGTILQRKGRGRIWGRELESSGKKKKQTDVWILSFKMVMMVYTMIKSKKKKNENT